MKTIILLIAFILSFSYCKKEEQSNKAIEFMEKIKSESYNEIFLPDLEPEKDVNTIDKMKINPLEGSGIFWR